jgi:glucose/arabinose dehydrogenase
MGLSLWQHLADLVSWPTRNRQAGFRPIMKWLSYLRSQSRSRLVLGAMAFLWLAMACGCRRANAVDSTPVPTAASEATPTPGPLQAELVIEDTGFVIALAFAADGRLFYAQQDGKLFSQVLNGRSLPVASAPELLSLDVAQGTESGLLGLALSPHFEEDNLLYVYYSVPGAQHKPIMGRISRFVVSQQGVSPESIIVSDLPARPDQLYHFGGALSFGPDGRLYLIFGDTNRTDTARDPYQLPGSILRYNADGTIPDDNPFPGSPVYAYGIRNGFGLAWNEDAGLLYETENGTQCDDELNLIEAGGDYGWGVHPYDTCPYPDDTGIAPLFQWPRVIAPANVIYYTGQAMPELQGDLILCGHNEMKLWHLSLSDDGRSLRRAVKLNVPGMDYACRVALAQGPEGWIYSALDGQIYRIGR